MALLTTQNISLTGNAISYVSANAGGDTFTPNGRNFLHIKNGGASPITVTIDSKVLSNYGTDVDLVVSVPAGGDRMIGSFDVQRFTDPSTFVGNITYSAVTSVTVAIINLP